jgi:hypothetical protein
MSLNEDRNSRETSGENQPTQGENGASTSEGGAETEPWPLATDAVLRVLAWPKYDDLESLKRVLMVAEPLLDNQNYTLLLRHDPDLDIPQDQAIEQLNKAFDAMGLKGDLKVLFVDDAMTPEDWPRLGKAVNAVLKLDPNTDETREAFVSAMGVEVIDGAEAFAKNS